MSKNNFTYPKGSEWRKWDLHVHTPFSYLNCEFGTDFDEYVKQLFKKALEKNIAAIGITDYFTIEGYKKLKNEYLGKDRKLKDLGFSEEEINKIKNILLLPNIEFRLNKLVGSNRINFHVIFSDEVNINDIEENFLREIKFVYEGTPQNEDEKRPLSISNLQSLGERLKREHDKFRSKADIEVGMMTAVVDDTEILKILSNKKSIFEGKYLTFVPADEDLSEISWDSQDHNVRKVIIQKSDGFFSSNQGTREFGLGHRHPSVEKFLEEFKTLKPCIWGSDAKNYEKLFEPDLKRYTWIKADPTFEGLKQILYEPEERVYIGEEPPHKIERNKIIKSITIFNSNKWFEDNKPIPLNEGLVSIIGGKGTGKTAILDLIAYATGSYKCYEEDEMKSKSFLKKAFKELKGASIKLEWDDGAYDEITIGDKLEEADKEGKVRYLPQDFTDQLCSEIGKEELEKQIENVIFQKIPSENRANFTDFKSYKDTQLKVINDKKNRVSEQIAEINLKIHEHNELIRSKDKINEEIKKVDSEIERFHNEMEKISDLLKDSKDQKEILNKINSSIDKRSELEKKISELNTKLLKIEEIENELNRFYEDSEAFIKRLKNDFQEIEITQEEIDKIKFVLYPENLNQILESRKKEIIEEIEKRKVDLNKIKKDIEDLNNKLTVEKSKQDKIKEINNSLSDLKKKSDSLNNEIKKINEAEKALTELLDSRRKLFVNYFELIFEEKEKLKEIYRPLRKILEESGEENEKLFDFTVKFDFDIDRMAAEGHELIDLRADGKFRQSKPEVLREELEKLRFVLDFDKPNISDDEKEAIKKFLEEVRALFTKGEGSISSQLKQRYTEQDFDNWLFSTKYYSMSYSIKFNGIELNNLSPGLKGVALLILFLELDRDDKRPILIDQPEENLDNRSVYTTLVRYFREAKKRRQIIIVTHNPNLVVNTDSEQVIVANFDKGLEKQASRISYVSGSLENTFKNDSASIILEKKGIREHVCEILEGGEEAFKKRENKYQIK
jgi:DNA repair exonuclease SbcCD ATPase subunit